MSELPVHDELKYSRRQAWSWIPTLYFAEGVPYVVVMTVAVIMYKRMGVSNMEIALYTSWLYLPWVIKPFWSPLVDLLRTKRWWIVAMQLLIGAGLAGVALTLPTSNFLQYTLAFFWLLAFSSATHDIAADGFYMLAMPAHEQTWFVGIRSTFYRLAMIAGQGLLVMLAGAFEVNFGLPETVVTVRAIEQETSLSSIDIPVDVPQPTKDIQRILPLSESFDLSTIDRSPAEITRLREEVKNWNVDHSFYVNEKPGQTIKQGERPRWLVALEESIVRWFGPEKIAATEETLAGDCVIVWMKVAKPVSPDSSLVVNISRSGGDSSFQIVEGTRFLITEKNWNTPFAALVQVDPKLNKPSEATFSAISGNIPLAWSITFYLLAAFFVGIGAYHMIVIPKPAEDVEIPKQQFTAVISEFFICLATFFQKPHIIATLFFLMFYRFSEAQLAKMASPFLLDPTSLGGLGLTTGQVGLVYGTVGITMLTLGGILGGIVASRQGLKFWLWWMVAAINLPNVVYVFLSQVQPENFVVINLCVAVEQFGYGFGFTAFMLYMLYISSGEHETAHYAICTGFMALGMMLPGMLSGWLQELIGYQHFFLWVMIATIPSFIVCGLVNIDPAFGRKSSTEVTT